MAAGPYPTKVMHESLKTRVATLENAPGGGGGGEGNFPGYVLLSDEVALDTAGKRPIDPSEIPNEAYVRTAKLVLASDAPPLTITAIANDGAGVSIFAFSSQQQANLDNADLINDVYISSGAFHEFFTPVTLPPGAVINLGYEEYVSVGSVGFQADPDLPPYVTYTSQAMDVSSNPIRGLTVGLPLQFIKGRNVYGPLAPDAMNVKTAAGPLDPGEFEILDTGSGAPTLRYCDASGTIYRLEMTPEV